MGKVKQVYPLTYKIRWVRVIANTIEAFAMTMIVFSSSFLLNEAPIPWNIITGCLIYSILRALLAFSKEIGDQDAKIQADMASIKNRGWVYQNKNGINTWHYGLKMTLMCPDYCFKTKIYAILDNIGVKN